MSRAIDWTPEMEAQLRRMRHEHCSVPQIADALQVSRHAVTGKMDRLRMVTGVRFRNTAEPEPADPQLTGIEFERRLNGALPPGHPVSWGVISRSPFGAT